MKSPRLASLVITAALALLPAQAFAIGFGIEGGGTYTKTSGLGSPNDIWTLNGGIIIENSFPIAVLFLDLWADVQTPIQLQMGPTTGENGGSSAAAPKYVPIDLGLRLGLNLGLLQPYVGVLGQAGILTDSAGVPSLNNPLWGLGGDIGLDIAIAILRLGIELRGVETLTAIATNPDEGSAFEFEALASVRLSF